MAVDTSALRFNLHRFYDFTGKTVLYVGAGNRQIFDLSVGRKVIAIDRAAEALHEASMREAAARAGTLLEVVPADFAAVRARGDVAYFEFCLHEMVEPDRALAHARTLATDVVVFDHSPGSSWSFYAAEDAAVRRAAEAAERLGVRRRESYYAEQVFRDHAELLAKLAGQGPVAIERVRRFEQTKNIAIPMPYGLALL
jgi:hypothetical protein